MVRIKKQQSKILFEETNVSLEPHIDEESSVSVEIPVVVKSKRGRKSKKYIQQQLELQKEVNNKVYNSNEVTVENNNEFICKDVDDNQKNVILQFSSVDNLTNVDNNSINELIESQNKPPAKKRGRKPKGGKIVQQIIPVSDLKENKPNIILHLKCFLKDLEYNLMLNNIDSYNFNGKSDLNYDIISVNNNFKSLENDIVNSNLHIKYNELNKDDIHNVDTYNEYDDTKNYENNEKINNDIEIKEIWKKLKILEHNLHVNNISDKKSACFWCTYDFDTPPIYIPKHMINDSYHVYGCFCSPECATSFLMEENIDSSTKFERYHLINHIYSKIYDYKKNIKPAPNPFYMLEKYYGNLTIQEYRTLFKNERSFLIVDKPLTRVLPEFHEDNDDFIINNKIIPSNTYQIKKKIQNKYQTKNNILNEKFGISS
jgi:hypothetical protein